MLSWHCFHFDEISHDICLPFHNSCLVGRLHLNFNARPLCFRPDAFVFMFFPFFSSPSVSAHAETSFLGNLFDDSRCVVSSCRHAASRIHRVVSAHFDDSSKIGNGVGRSSRLGESSRCDWPISMSFYRPIEWLFRLSGISGWCRTFELNVMSPVTKRPTNTVTIYRNPKVTWNRFVGSLCGHIIGQVFRFNQNSNKLLSAKRKRKKIKYFSFRYFTLVGAKLELLSIKFRLVCVGRGSYQPKLGHQFEIGSNLSELNRIAQIELQVAQSCSK